MQGLLRNLHWIIIFIALAKFGYTFYDYYEKDAENQTVLEKTKADLAKSMKTKSEIKKYLNNIEQEKARIERVAQEIEKTQQLLPSEISDSENINLLRKMSEDVNIKEISINPENEEARSFLIARKYRFKAKATYLQFLIMFEKISESKRILNVSEIVFRKLEQPQRSKFQLIDGEFFLEAYKYNSNYKEDRGIEQLEKQFGTKTEEKAPKRSKKSKENTE